MKRIVLGLTAHVDSGKTTLSEVMLFHAGEIRKLGRVDHKNAFLDTDALERSRGITIFAKQAVIRLGGDIFTLLDTPGHVDFSAEAERALSVLDYAVLVISGTDGVQSHTETLWRLLRRYCVPTFVFVNKMDISLRDKASILAELNQKLGGGFIDFSISENELSEQAADYDEECMNSFLDSGAVSAEQLSAAISQRKIFPTMFGSALKDKGIDELLSVIGKYCAEPPRSEEFSARVYKITQDESGARLTHLKVTGGVLKVKSTVGEEKINQIRVYSGVKFNAVDEAPAGTLCAVTGLSQTRAGQGLGAEENAAAPLLEPVLSYKLLLPPQTDIPAALDKLRTLEEEEPQLRVVWSEQHKEIHLRLMGEIQLEVLKSVIAERFGLAVEFDRGSISYKETIASPVVGAGHYEPLRHYAEVHLLLEPAERGSGLQFVSDCRKDDLDTNWQRLILTHLAEKQHIGVLTGSPITDMKISVVAGRAHIKHTEGGAFRQATYRAVRQGLASAKSVLLEPFYDFTLEVPSGCVGRAMTDLQRMG
ncbi:MAG: TetM/TetW/TetO/TetS family tetracycline resistance ribosomal protection protein, partial [Oscillospiraceae bacterium]|nr:TetM/TetW/TetO/TetS family tetracycline resistance ribosomal protection protein [Oscillospiraceae bacterium]